MLPKREPANIRLQLLRKETKCLPTPSYWQRKVTEMKQMIWYVLAAAIVTAGVVLFFGKTEEPQAVMTGIITQVTPSATEVYSGTILVEDREKKSAYDKASVSITSQTELLSDDGEPLSFGDLSEGQQVKIYYSGPVMESYPVQFAADRVVVQTN